MAVLEISRTVVTKKIRVLVITTMIINIKNTKWTHNVMARQNLFSLKKY